MCDFDYFRYDACKHLCIEVRTYCNSVIWKAGLSGVLNACTEQRYYQWLNACTPFPREWVGMKGFCRFCAQKYQFPGQVPAKSDNNVVYERKDFPSLLSPEHDPFVYLPSLLMSIPEMVGLDDQYELHQIDLGERAYFPPRAATYDRQSNHCKHEHFIPRSSHCVLVTVREPSSFVPDAIMGFIDGVAMAKCSDSLYRSILHAKGFTTHDKDAALEAFQQYEDGLDRIWRR